MFCPNAKDWGNIADWVAGIGSLLAVAAAIWLAYRQSLLANRSAKKVRRSLIAEVMRLVAEIENNARTHSKAKILDLCDHLRSMGDLAKNDPQLFGEIAMSVRQASFTPEDTAHNREDAGFARIALAMQKRQQVFRELLKD